jgi:hypothetical protein
MDNFGGPVWHASGRGRNRATSLRIALDSIAAAGDESAGQWEADGSSGIVHVQRRLSSAERVEFAVPDPYDIRGTREERDRVLAVLAEAPHLAGVLA